MNCCTLFCALLQVEEHVCMKRIKLEGIFAMCQEYWDYIIKQSDWLKRQIKTTETLFTTHLLSIDVERQADNCKVHIGHSSTCMPASHCLVNS